MPDNSVTSSGSDPWSELLQQSRCALATLRVDVLEELVGRAERMRAATVGSDASRQRIASPLRKRTPGVAHEIGLLRELLVETERNLKVLQVTRGDALSRGRGGEVRQRWVR
jgi:hypothetical protein